MTGQPTGAWRVKLGHAGGYVSTPGMTEDAAVVFAADLARDVAGIRDGAALLPFPTRHGVNAWVRARDVRTIEPVGPRWDGVEGDEPPRGHQHEPARVDRVPTSLVQVDGTVPLAPVDGTTWLQERTRQAETRLRGNR